MKIIPASKAKWVRLFFCISKVEDISQHEQVTFNLWQGLSLNESEYLVARDKFPKQDAEEIAASFMLSLGYH